MATNDHTTATDSTGTDPADTGDQQLTGWDRHVRSRQSIRDAERNKDISQQSGQKRRQFIRFLKIAIPALCVAFLIAVFVVLIGMNNGQKLPTIPGLEDFGNLEIEQAEIGLAKGEGYFNFTPQIKLQGTRYHGVDEQGRPFAISADQISQGIIENSPVDLGNIIHFSRPTADFSFEEEGWIALKAEQGFYQDQVKKLELSGNVFILTSDGIRFITDKLHVNVNTKRAYAPGKISVYDRGRKLYGQSMEVLNQGRLVIVNGPAKLTFTAPRPASASQKTDTQ